MTHVTLSELYGSDTIRGFHGMVSVQDNENFVLVNEAGAYSGDDDRKLEIVRFDTPRPFYSPYHENAPVTIRVHGEIRPVDYETLPENQTLFGYTAPGPLSSQPVIFANGRRFEINCNYVTHDGEFYRLIAPELPTPTCVVRVEKFTDLEDRYNYDNVRIVGHIVDNKLGERIDASDLDLPEDFDEYIESSFTRYDEFLQHKNR